MKFLANMLLFKFNIGHVISLSYKIFSKYVAIQVYASILCILQIGSAITSSSILVV
jgi:hypothetical protein